jgi:predicted Ser/Thr protein kinase/cytoskeletal protein RodZ
MPFTLSDYTDIKEFATGGMSKIYVAVQVSLNRTVIIKEMASGLLTTKNEIKRFENEARSGAFLTHDNIIRIYDFGEEKGSFYIAMEFIDGSDLDQLLKQEDCPKELAMMVLQQALKGLAFAHEQGIVHRDVKPANILISRNGAVKMVDFGLAYAGARSGQLTTTGAIVGTPVYMSPELVNGEETKDRCMDIWAAGVVLYRIITGEFPFSGENVPSTLIDIIQNKEKPAEDLDKTMPSAITDLLHRCLEKDHTKRLPSLTPLIGAMQDYFFEVGVRDPVDTIKKYFTDKTAALADLHCLLFQYHCAKARELLKTERHTTALAHFKEARKYGPQDKDLEKEIRTLEDYIANTLTSRTATLQDYVVSEVRAKDRKKKAGKGKVIFWTAAVLVLLAAAGAGSYYAYGQHFVFLQHFDPMNKVTTLVKALIEKTLGGPLQNETSEKPEEQSASPAASSREQKSGRPAAAQNEWARAFTDEKHPDRHNVAAASGDSAAPTGPAAPQRQATDVKAPERPAKDAYGGLVKVEVAPPVASVKVDDKALTNQEMTAGITLTRGVHHFSAAAEGYAPGTASIAVLGNDTHFVMINLIVAEKKTGMLQIVSDLSAEIYVDGELKGSAPLTSPIALPEGQHTITFKRPGYKPYDKTVVIRAGETHSVKVLAQTKNPAE